MKALRGKHKSPNLFLALLEEFVILANVNLLENMNLFLHFSGLICTD